MILLFLMDLGTASVRAQVRIGGNTAPNAAAALDLNATDATNNGSLGLSLPRVSLTTTADLLNGRTPLDGTLVYNTNAALGVGLYYWVTNKWVSLGGSDAPLNVTAELDQDYTVKATDDIVLFTTTSAVRAVTLPTTGIPIGKKIYISDKGAMGLTFDKSFMRTESYTFMGAGTAATLVFIGGNPAKWEAFSGY